MRKLYILLYALVFMALAGISAGEPTYNKLSHYWKLDNTSFADEILSYDGTAVGNAYISGSIYKLGNGSAAFDGDSDGITISPDDNLCQALTVCAWVRWDNTQGENGIVYSFSTVTNGDEKMQIDSAGNGADITCRFATSGGEKDINNASVTATSGTWEYFCCVHDDANNQLRIYKNGVASAWASTGAVTQSAESCDANAIGKWYSNANSDFKGYIDEIATFNVTLSDANISKLYNSGAGWAFPLAETMTIAVNSPANNTNTTSQLTVNFTITTTDNSDGNCYLYVDDAYNTSAAFTHGSSATISPTANLTEGQHNWTLTCNTSTILDTSTDTYQYYLDSDYPSCNFGSAYSVVNLPKGYTFNVTCTDAHFFSMNVTCDSGWNYTQVGQDATVYNFTQTFTTNSSFTADRCDYRYCDGFGGAEINCVTGNFTIDSAWLNYGSLTPFACPFTQSIQESIGFGLIWIVVFIAIAINIALIRIPLLDGFMAVVTIFLSITLWNCNEWLTYFFMIFGLSYLMYAIIRASSNMGFLNG